MPGLRPGGSVPRSPSQFPPSRRETPRSSGSAGRQERRSSIEGSAGAARVPRSSGQGSTQEKHRASPLPSVVEKWNSPASRIGAGGTFIPQRGSYSRTPHVIKRAVDAPTATSAARPHRHHATHRSRREVSGRHSGRLLCAPSQRGLPHDYLSLSKPPASPCRPRPAHRLRSGPPGLRAKADAARLRREHLATNRGDPG